MGITNQVLPIPGRNPYVNQATFGQILGRVLDYNRGCDPSVVQNLINNVVRRIYDRRMWYGLLAYGQIVAPGIYQTGTVNLTLGSPIVQGNGTSWTTALVGQQLRVGYSYPIYNIIAVNTGSQQITLDLPWGSPSQSTLSYFIAQYYYSFPNIKYFYSVKNLQLMYRMITNVSQSLLENWDPSRLQLLYPWIVATMPPDSSGNYRIEMWPAPSSPQAFPYIAYTQPPNLVEDSDPFPAFIRSDVVEAGAIAEILLHNPKNNPGYSEASALNMSARFSKQFEFEMEKAVQADEALFRQDTLWQSEMSPVAIDWSNGRLLGGGGFIDAMSAVGAYDY